MRPGPPDGRRRAASATPVLFGLPGNPVAVMVTFLAFVRPALLRMMGCTRHRAALLQGAQRRAAAQEARTHRVPARHRQHGQRRIAAGAHHRQPGLGRAELHGAGQRLDRAASRARQRRRRRRGGRDDVRRRALGACEPPSGYLATSSPWCSACIFGDVGLVRARHFASREQRVHRGHDEDREQRAERHAADDHPADLRPAFRTGARGQRQRHRAQHHRAGRHQDRAAGAASAALTTASTMSSPCSRSWLANSTIRMPCLVIRPTSVIRPIC